MNENRLLSAVQGMILSYVLLLAALAIHEVAHLAVLYAMRRTGSLLVVPWRLGSMNYYIYGLHVQPSQPLPVLDQAFLNFSGPILAAVPLVLLYYYVRDRIPRAALLANILILFFFAVLESSDELLESALGREVGILGSPEFNIGIPVLIILLVVYQKMWKKT